MEKNISKKFWKSVQGAFRMNCWYNSAFENEKYDRFIEDYINFYNCVIIIIFLVTPLCSINLVTVNRISRIRLGMIGGEVREVCSVNSTYKKEGYRVHSKHKQKCQPFLSDLNHIFRDVKKKPLKYIVHLRFKAHWFCFKPNWTFTSHHMIILYGSQIYDRRFLTLIDDMFWGFCSLVGRE